MCIKQSEFINQLAKQKPIQSQQLQSELERQCTMLCITTGKKNLVERHKVTVSVDHLIFSDAERELMTS